MDVDVVLVFCVCLPPPCGRFCVCVRVRGQLTYTYISTVPERKPKVPPVAGSERDGVERARQPLMDKLGKMSSHLAT